MGVRASIVLCFLALACYGATTYYVATNGNDATGDGSGGNPWLTLQKALDSIAAGDTVLVQPGYYTNSSYLRTQTGGAARTTLKANGAVTNAGSGLWLAHSNYTVDGFVWDQVAFSYYVSACIGLISNAHGSTIVNNTFQRCSDGPHGVWWTVCGDAVSPRVHTTPTMGASGCIVSNNYWNDFWSGQMVKMAGTNNLIVSNRFHNIRSGDIFVVHGGSNIFRGNWVSNCTMVTGGLHPDLFQTYGQDGNADAPYFDSIDHVFENNQFWDCKIAIAQLTRDTNDFIAMGNWTWVSNLFVRCGSVDGSVSSCVLSGLNWRENVFVQCGCWPASAGSPLSLGFYATVNNIWRNAINSTIWSNTFVACGRNAGLYGYEVEYSGYDQATGLTTNYNAVAHWNGTNWTTCTGFNEDNGVNSVSDARITAYTNLVDYSYGTFGRWADDNSLLLRYDFDEAEAIGSGFILDTTGNNHEAYREDATNFIGTAAGIGKAGYWHTVGTIDNDPPNSPYNVSQYGAILRTNDLDYLTAGTIMVWVQWAATAERYDTILDCGYPPSGDLDPTKATNTWAIHYGVPTALGDAVGPIFFNYGTNAAADLNSPIIYVQWTHARDGSTWHHIAATWDVATGNVIGYENGASFVTTPMGAPWLRINGNLATPWICLGAMQHGGTPQWGDDKYPNSGFFKGKMDDLRIYNRALTETEVQAIYNTGLAGFGGSAPTRTANAVTVHVGTMTQPTP